MSATSSQSERVGEDADKDKTSGPERARTFLHAAAMDPFVSCQTS